MGRIENDYICQGCGVAIQTENKHEAGYIPASALKNETIICQRCFRLKHYNEIQDVPYSDGDFLKMISQISETTSLIVKLVDIFDFNGSFIKSLQRLTGNNPIILIGNKIDLLPKSTNLNRLKQWMKKEAADLGLTVQDVFLVSAKTGLGYTEVKSAIEYYRNGQDVYVVGSTNVGKSTFINYLINESVGEKDVITTSYFPGTTLGFIEIPLDQKTALYDTPGVVNRSQITHYLSQEDIKVITPNKEIKPRVYQLNSRQTLYIGGLARFDFIKGNRQSFTCYFANQINIHRTKLDHANNLYNEHLGKLLSPPNEKDVKNYPALVEKTIKIAEDRVDIVFPGLGWITLSGVPATIAVHTPLDVPVSKRKAII
ncbi:ribosome biogenesis GTPase YqeH [Amphibacillus sp. MSJ-3]|uniref:ribosome biogenesis GTPase YqeH n=1 Tax=Amphibacillus sp. MSJ-3 TaxID=2841505 RepID=UPI001C0EEC0E|nr:ribosome biogenesis GTPase YqeH [Amphibacillus sp. MSJ-3]MBU5595315.1 ribosome biogenesis GTPase YqeH [Amphibacillus sp. MSJ-3]